MRYCKCTSGKLKLNFKIPLNTSNEISIKLQKLKNEISMSDFKSITQLEKMVDLPENYLKKNWKYYGNQINTFPRRQEYKDRKKYSNVIDAMCIERCTNKLKTPNNLLKELKLCRKFRDEMQLTYSQNTRLLNKIDLSFSIIERHLIKGNFQYARSLIIKYFTTDNYVLHTMYLLYPRSRTVTFIDGDLHLKYLNLSSRARLLLELDNIYHFKKLMKIQDAEFEKQLLTLFLKYGKSKIADSLYKMNIFIEFDKMRPTKMIDLILEKDNVYVFKSLKKWLNKNYIYGSIEMYIIPDANDVNFSRRATKCSKFFNMIGRPRDTQYPYIHLFKWISDWYTCPIELKILAYKYCKSNISISAFEEYDKEEIFKREFIRPNLTIEKFKDEWPNYNE